jgi:hypothetical protein
MPTVHVEAQISEQELFRAAEQLSVPELERFVQQILTLRARRVAPVLSSTETELLLLVNKGLPPADQDRYQFLIERRQDGCLTSEEHAELVHISDRVEGLQVDRLRALSELAALRKTSLSQLMTDLGLPIHDHD